MSGFNTLRDNAPAPPKQMSSRLLTMKFMQRASSTNSRTTANRTPSSSLPTTPASEPVAKRQKIIHTPDSSSPNTPATEAPVYASRADVKAALESESAFEALARVKRAELGFGHNEFETEWVLSLSPLPTVPTAQEIISDEDESDSEEEEPAGRQTFGGYKRHKNNKTTLSRPGSKLSTPAQKSRYDDMGLDDFDSNASDSEDVELSSDTDHRSRSRGSGRAKKRKADTLDEDDEVAMSALDRVDLSKTGYAKAKQAGTTMGPMRSGNEEKAKGKGKKNKQHHKDFHGKPKGKKK